MTRQEFHLFCEQAEGYIALGLCEEAWALIEALPEALRLDTVVLSLQVKLLSASSQYMKASFLAQTLADMYPAEVDRRILVSRLRWQAGDLSGAWDYASKALSQFEHGRLFYIKAQCEAGLGSLEHAKASLQRAFQLMPSLRLQALDDPAFAWLFQIDDDDRDRSV